MTNDTAVKRESWDFYRETLGSPKYVVAPMVDQSELAWRELCRRHGAQLCYTPMYHSQLFVKDAKYRNEALQTCASDRPLIFQFCGNDPKLLLDAAILAQDHCDAVDINLGCPQAIARRGHYGSYLQDEWDLLQEIVSTLHKTLRVPVTCKIRIFEDRKRTVEYAQMLVKAGAQLLTVHGRTREMKGPLTGIADWSYIKLVRESVDVPVFANGNIMSIEDVHRCIEETGVVGVMSAEGNLNNPFIFEGKNAVTWEAALEYLDLVDLYPVPSSFVRAHMFKIFQHLMVLPSNYQMRERMATSHTIAQFRETVLAIRDKYQPYHDGVTVYEEERPKSEAGQETAEPTYNLKLPVWICQPYVRAPPEEHKKKLEKSEAIAADPKTVKRQFFDVDGNEISRKRMKKLRRASRRPEMNQSGAHVRASEMCPSCMQPRSQKCDYCRPCCRDHCANENVDCLGHKHMYRTRREEMEKLAKETTGPRDENETIDKDMETEIEK